MNQPDHDSDAPRPAGPGARGADHLSEAARRAALDLSLDDLRARLQEQLPGIDLGECVGRGGMGAVFRGRQRALDRTVAVKALLPPTGDAAQWLGRFQREARALARLQHPGIVTVHDHGHAEGLAWLVMEFIEGTDLRLLMDDGRLTPDEALAIVPPVCEALHYAHERGVVHRDIKPENILLDTDGRVRLVDFGLAKLAADEGGANLTRTDQAMGTPRYMAPEQLERPHEVDHRADIFSLGVVLYEMLTGQVPAGVIEPPSRKVAVDVRLDEVVLRSLQREPERRYQSASELEAGVRGASGLPATAEAPAPPVAPAIAGAPVRTGFTLADLVALLLPLAAMLAAAASPMFAELSQSRSDTFIHDTYAMVLSPVMWLLWWCLPLTTAIHTFRSRRRETALRLSMPMVRVAWALALVVATVAMRWSAGRSTVEAQQGTPRRYSDYLPELEGVSQSASAVHDGTMMALGLLVAVLGAWSRRGAHRRLFSERMTRSLAGIVVVLAVLPVLFTHVAGLTAWLTGKPSATLQDAALHSPLLIGGVVGATLLRSRGARAATYALVVSAAPVLLLHLSVGVLTGQALLLLVGVALGLVTVAGAAEPLPRTRG